ncbi:hypothetical protein ACFWDZ_32345, partial [Micromonospora aurantiaca]
MTEYVERSKWNPYGVIESYWGEGLSPELIRRIANAPESHLEAFKASFHGLGVGLIPPLPAGHLRPVVSVHMADFVGQRQGDDLWAANVAAANAALVTLLYAHEIVLDPPTEIVASPDKHLRYAALRWLMEAKPLFDRGIIHFAPVTSLKTHPSGRTSQYRELVDHLVQERHPEIEGWLRYALQRSGVTEQEVFEASRYHLIDELVVDALSFTRYSKSWPGRIHRLLRSKAEEAIAAAAIGYSQGQPRNSREVRLGRLLEVGLPGFAPSARALVTIRQNDEAFAEWRHFLSGALNSITISDPTSPEQLRIAREVMYGEMEPIQQRVRKATAKSPALQALKSGSFG